MTNNTDLISRADAEALFRNARGELHKSAIRNEQNGHPIKDLPTRDLMLLNAEQMIHLLPSVTPKLKPCEDTISRQAVLSIIDESKEDDADKWMDYPWKTTPNLLMDEVRKLPLVTPSVIEDIKAEIKQKREENRNGEYDKIFELCLLIIDKHISGKEQA